MLQTGLIMSDMHIFVTTLISVTAGLSTANVCMWLGPSHRQAEDNEKISGVDGSLTNCGDAQKESENKAFIQVFHPIQSVKSTNKVTLASLTYAPRLNTDTFIDTCT